MKRKKKALAKELSLVTPSSDLIDKMMQETDLDEFNKIKALFDLNMKKKDLIRVNKLNELQDKAVNEMSARLELRSGEFNNKDLLEYFKTIQEVISKTDTNLDNIDVSKIKIIQNQYNIALHPEEAPLTKESRDKILSAVQSILSDDTIENSEIIQDVDFEEIEED